VLVAKLRSNPETNQLQKDLSFWCLCCLKVLLHNGRKEEGKKKERRRKEEGKKKEGEGEGRRKKEEEEESESQKYISSLSEFASFRFRNATFYKELSRLNH
jgi:hypothetical protein